MNGPSLQQVTITAQQNAQKTIKPYTIRTPLIPLNFKRPDLPHLQIYLKLETHQPGVGSFKIRGASNAIVSRIDNNNNDLTKDTVVITASAGNMGQGVAHVCSTLQCRCIVIVPTNAPLAKCNAILHLYDKAEIIRVPYDEWWNIIETSDCSSIPQIGSMNHVFIHPVCDAAVIAGNSTVGMEILQDCEDVDAIFVPYGGGGLTCGIGSAVCNHDDETKKNQCAIVSCEPETAAPMALSKERGEISSFAKYYQPSFCDGCGGKAVLSPMWDLANQVIDYALSVPLSVAEAGVWTLHERNGVVAEGAGGLTVGAAMFCPAEKFGEGVKDWKKVVCVVSGRGIDRSKLFQILDKYDNMETVANGCLSANWTVRGSNATMSNDASSSASLMTTSSLPITTMQEISKAEKLTVLTEKEVEQKLPMHKCIQSTKEALIALSNKTGKMPIRQVSQLPQNEIQKPGYLVTMPSYHDGYAACKLITVYPQNSNTPKFSSHQGVVALFNAKQNGQLLLLADAHQITSTRTAAASAVATMTLARKESHVLAILGTGEQARSHFVSMLETGLPIVQVNLWGRNNDHALKLKEDLRLIFNTYEWKTKCKSTMLFELDVFSTVKECVEVADIICTLVPSTDPILRGEWIRPGTHINAVGACLPTQREMDGTCVAKAALYCDSKDACFVEAGDVVLALKEGSIDSQDRLLDEIGSVLIGEVEGRVNEEQITLFKSLGIALEDLTAVRAIHDAS